MYYVKMLKTLKPYCLSEHFSGAGRIAFTNQNSYMKAITDRYVQLSHGEVEKRVSKHTLRLD